MGSDALGKGQELENMQGWRLALGPLRHTKPGLAPPFLGPFFGRNGPLWVVWGFEISMREPNSEPFSWFELPFSDGGQKKVKVCEHTKNLINHPVDRPKCMSFDTSSFKNVLLT